MTLTAQQARALTLLGDFKSHADRLIPKRAAPEKLIQFYQGLSIQPFFNDLVKCRPDFEYILDMIGPYNVRELKQAVQPVHLLNHALDRAGYSHMGQPYWVSVHAPDPDDFKRIAEAARGCIPLLQKRYSMLVKKATIGTDQDKKAFLEFMDRFARYHAAYQGLDDWAQTVAFQKQCEDQAKSVPVLSLE